MTRLAPLMLKLTALLTAMAVAGVGLAVAGVDLPGHAHKRAGHASSSSRAGDVHAVIEGTPPSERGCAFGHAVATAARGSELPAQAQAACTHGNHSGDEGTSSARRHRAAHSDVDSSAGHEFGQDTARRAKGQRTATPEQRHQFGQDTAQGAHQLGAHPDATSTPQGGPSTGQTHSQAGPSMGEQASGGHGP